MSIKFTIIRNSFPSGKYFSRLICDPSPPQLVKTAVREMWSLEYEVDELQSKFSESIFDQVSGVIAVVVLS